MISRRSLTASLVLSGIAGHHAASAQEGETILDRVRRTKIMRIGAVNAQPPYCYKDLATGEWAGFMIDIARDLATELGATIQPVESTWGNAVLDVQTNKVDIFFGLAPTPQRTLAVDFTTPLYDNAFSLIARTGFSPAHWDDLNNPDTRIAVELGSVYDQMIATLCPKATIARLKTNNDALMTVQAGRADCQMIVVILGLTVLARNPSLGHLVVPAPLFSSPTAAIMAKSPSPAWRDTVNEWIGRRRHAGWLRQVLVANLEKVGVRGEDVPPQLLF
jgi:polar amino acid transport system substrate-binding protein